MGSVHAERWDALTAERSQRQPTFASICASLYPVGLGAVSTFNGSMNTLPRSPSIPGTSDHAFIVGCIVRKVWRLSTSILSLFLIGVCSVSHDVLMDVATLCSL